MNKIANIVFYVFIFADINNHLRGSNIFQVLSLGDPDIYNTLVKEYCNTVVNYTIADVPFTRMIEHKWFKHGLDDNYKTIVTHEYSQKRNRNREPLSS